MTTDEYMLGLKRLESQDRFPAHALAALSCLSEMVAQYNCTLARVTVHRYSKEIFTRVAFCNPLGCWLVVRHLE